MGAVSVSIDLQVQGGEMTIDELADGCWYSMRNSLFRRALLGKKRCTQIVMMTLADFPDKELVGATPGSACDRRTRQELANLVEVKFRQQAVTPNDTYNAVFMTVILAWAIKLIVSWLIDQWFSGKVDMQAIRTQYGWKR